MTGAGATVGAVIGALGSTMTVEARAALGTLVALAGVIVGVLEVSGVRVPLLEQPGQTPRKWLQEGAFLGPAKNGVALGLGFFTKIGFSMWYLIPFGALLSGSPLGGSIIYGTYAFVRGLGVWGIMWAIRIAGRRKPQEEIYPGDWLIGKYRTVRLSLSTVLMGFGTASLVAVGL